MAQGLLKLSTHTSSINIVKYHKLLGPFEFSRTSRNTSLYFIKTSYTGCPGDGLINTINVMGKKTRVGSMRSTIN